MPLWCVREEIVMMEVGLRIETAGVVWRWGYRNNLD